MSVDRPVLSTDCFFNSLGGRVGQGSARIVFAENVPFNIGVPA